MIVMKFGRTSLGSHARILSAARIVKRRPRRENINAEMKASGASEINISFLVHERTVRAAVRALHRDFFGK